MKSIIVIVADLPEDRKDLIKVTLSAARRLSSDGRRLAAGAVLVDFVIQIPASNAGTQDTIRASLVSAGENDGWDAARQQLQVAGVTGVSSVGTVEVNILVAPTTTTNPGNIAEPSSQGYFSSLSSAIVLVFFARHFPLA